MTATATATATATPASLAEADALHARVLAKIAGGGEPFDALAASIARHQARYSAGYARLCAARGVDPERDPPSALPAVPTDAFKLARVATFPEALDAAVFRTSGTTAGARGAHAMRTLSTYHDAAMVGAASTLFAPFGARARIVAVAPSPAQTPESSLSRMLGWFVEERGDARSAFVRPDDVDEAIDTLERAALDGPLLVLATAFAWVHLIDRLDGRCVPLPRGSRAMQTGGFKGRSRELSAEELRGLIASTFELPREEVVGEYGMTELTSQLWATPEVGSTADRWLYRAPPWVRVTACDPATLQPLPLASRGIARIEDLGNVESAWAIQTADEVIVHEGGAVELLGRLPGATPRGCSLAVEELVSSPEVEELVSGERP
ncbi:MAG: acyl-protein synthetase [Deltaproteobacteria bacterium]|nr:acyl-protein synthetase [Deltaproteobacteria bacterium]